MRITRYFNRSASHTGSKRRIKGLADLEARFREYANNQALRDKMNGYTDMYLTGDHEIYRVWDWRCDRRETRPL